MKSILKLFILCGVLLTMAFSCEKEEVLPPGEAKGKIIQVLFRCYGSGLMIEVENPKGIGEGGTFKQIGCSCPEISFNNAIIVPVFERISDLHTNAPDSVGTWLHFKYREVTQEEFANGIFIDTSFHGICEMNIGPPSIPRFVVTKIIDYH